MTPGDFRRLALALPEALEASHHDHPDFRVRGKIFATLMPDGDHGMVKLSPAEQAVYVRSEPDVFQPVKGAWGRRGYTSVRLPAATEAAVREALLLAWRGTAPKRLAARFELPDASDAGLSSRTPRRPASRSGSRRRARDGG